MKKYIGIFVFVLLITTTTLPATLTITVEKISIPIFRNDNTLYVGGDGPENYSKIQDAIDNATDEDTVFVYNGTYVEKVVVDKSINLIGEDSYTTAIDGNESGDVVYVTVDWVNISGFTLKNSSMYNAELKIRSNCSTVTGNNFGPESRGYGIYLEYANYNTISGNYFSNTWISIILLNSENNNILDNNIVCGNNLGIYLGENSHFNSISDNHIAGISNTFALIEIDKDCNNTIVTDNSLFNGLYGVFTVVNWATNISGNIIDNCVNNGISLRGSWGELGGRHIVHGNLITNCGSEGIYCRENIFNNISNNYISSNLYYGFLILEANDNMIFNNTISSNEGHGIYFYRSSLDNIIFDNNIILNKGHGIYIMDSSHNNTIIENNIRSNNGYGIRIENVTNPSNNNTIYHNNIINNTFSGYDNCDNNTWDNGYPSGGNYWSDFNGTDDYRGIYQTIPGSDGLGDIPNYLDGGSNKDLYPLMYLWGEQRPVANFTYSMEYGGYIFNGLSSYDRDGVVLFYDWDFGDGSTSQEVIATHGYNESEAYEVTLTVTDNDGYEGFYTRSIEAEKNYPPGAPSIDGPTKGKSGKSHLYKFTSEDPELADVSYYVEWGDGLVTPWSNFLHSGEEYHTNHGWAKGTYTIRAKSKDFYGAESNWATLDVTIPKNKPFIFNFPLLNWLFDRFPKIFPILRWVIEVG